MSYGVTLRCVHHIWLQSIRGRTVTTKSCLAAVRMWPTSAQSCRILARQLNLIHPLIIFAHLVQYRSDICNFPYVWGIVLLVLFLVGLVNPWRRYINYVFDGQYEPGRKPLASATWFRRPSNILMFMGTCLFLIGAYANLVQGLVLTSSPGSLSSWPDLHSGVGNTKHSRGSSVHNL